MDQPPPQPDPRAFDDTPFWRFSLQAYGREGVAPACLAVQERHGLDVNLLLFCVFAGLAGWRFGSGDVARLEAAVGPWQDAVVRPLRAARRWLKDRERALGAEVAELRARIKEDELRAEAIEQRLLFACLPRELADHGGRGLVSVAEGRAAAEAAAANLAAYLAARGLRAEVTDLADLAAVLRGGLPALAPLEAVWLLAGACAPPQMEDHST